MAQRQEQKRREIKEQREREREAAIQSGKIGISRGSKALVADRGGGAPGGVGNRLYKEGLKKKAQREKDAEEMKLKKEQQVEDEATFAPTITDMAKGLQRRGPMWARVIDSTGEHARDHKQFLAAEVFIYSCVHVLSLCVSLIFFL